MSFQRRARTGSKGRRAEWPQLHNALLSSFGDNIYSLPRRQSGKNAAATSRLTDNSQQCLLSEGRRRLAAGGSSLGVRQVTGPHPGRGPHSRELGIDVLQVPAEGLTVHLLPLLDPRGHTEGKDKASEGWTGLLPPPLPPLSFMCVCIHVFGLVYVSLCMWLCVCVCVWVWVCACGHTRVSLCMCIKLEGKEVLGAEESALCAGALTCTRY